MVSIHTFVRLPRVCAFSTKSSISPVRMATPKILVDVYSDLACPWCYVGHAKLTKAIHNMRNQDQNAPAVEIQWHAFLLDPSFQEKYPTGTPIEDYIASKFGVDRAEAMKARLKQSGANEGVEFRNWKYRANTLPGHRLVALSRKYGKSHEANAVLFRKAYEEGENISDGDVLIEAAEELQLGASREEINAFVRGDEGVMEVLHDDEMAKRRFHVTGVPAFFIRSTEQGKAQLLSGAQPVEVFEEVFQQIKYEDKEQEKSI